ncbi:hypothetical protein L3X38_036521 [Prunus dulcis]|uniref:Sodium/calcium exchanger membrane region domain-containing protein n=1 Tax=Prunus dulcis TaxID=3755 RepID=A0AAD4V1M9_PRUDU|nr:hypothetical protein L3X38_036521 [Prunus dulcis]
MASSTSIMKPSACMSKHKQVAGLKESLSKILKLSPTIAGVTLLSLGNGASDVFSSIVSFTRSGDGDVGLNSVLGGAFFVSSIVVGVISILISPQQIAVDEASFVRDVIFFLFSLSSLLAIIVIGRINLWGAISFLAIYFVYVGTVSATQLYKRKNRELLGDRFSTSLAASKNLPVLQSFDDLGDSTSTPLLGYVDEDKPIFDTNSKASLDVNQEQNSGFSYLGTLIYILELPLYLPRRLTIPVVSEERWSKPYAVISVTLAPVLLAALCNTQRENQSSRVNGGPDGAQIAISGCYAGPMFNTLVGVGISLVFSSWSEYPSSYVIPIDHSLYETIAFLMGGLLWALVILPKKDMKLDRYMGIGLVAIYLCFLFLRMAMLLVF